MHVDDDEDIRQIVKLTLELIGKYSVAQFSSGQEAVDNAVNFAPQLIILDVMMPEMNGEETMHLLHKLPGLENVPIVFMTAKAEDGYSQKLIEQGALHVIIKPFDPPEICNQIQATWEAYQAS